MTQTLSIPILGMACASHVGEKLSGIASPDAISSRATDITSPFYALGDDTDRPERHFSILESVIDRALVRSGLQPDEIEHIGLFMGSSSYDLRSSELSFQDQLETQANDPIPVNNAGNCRLSDWVGSRFNICSDAFNINSACTSSANALLLARQMLNHGIIKHALVIGIELFNETTLCGFSGLQLLATERLSPFDKDRSGLLLGEGCAAVVVGSDDRDSRFWLAGSGASFDPHSITAANEDGVSIAACLRSALASSGVDASKILAIKAQGSGSHTNDLAESRGLQAVFGAEIPPLTAIKPYIGHTLGACGVLELVLFCHALADDIIPGTLNFSSLDPDLMIAPMTRDKQADAGFYLLNTFGFGGNNTVLVVEKRH
ncbi:MAG: beta-ketoacyl synthase N-terminal-like domain-containing protein [Pseudomonadota bacterium]